MGRSITLLACIVLLAVAVPCEATLHAFWSTAEKDGFVQNLTPREGICPDEFAPMAMSTGVVAAGQTSYKVIALGYVCDRIFFSFNTASLEGMVVDSAVVKMVVFDKAAVNWETNFLTDFTADCVSFPLSVVDTLCYVSADTTIPYTAIPAIGDTLTIVMRPTWVNKTGWTDIVMVPEREADVCSATSNNCVKLRTMEYGGTESDPRLYVWTSDADPLRHHLPKKERVSTEGR